MPSVFIFRTAAVYRARSVAVRENWFLRLRRAGAGGMAGRLFRWPADLGDGPGELVERGEPLVCLEGRPVVGLGAEHMDLLPVDRHADGARIVVDYDGMTFMGQRSLAHPGPLLPWRRLYGCLAFTGMTTGIFPPQFDCNRLAGLIMFCNANNLGTIRIDVRSQS